MLKLPSPLTNEWQPVYFDSGLDWCWREPKLRCCGCLGCNLDVKICEISKNCKNDVRIPLFASWHLGILCTTSFVQTDMYASEIFASLLPWPWSKSSAKRIRLGTNRVNRGDLMLEIVIASHLQNMDFTVSNAKKTKPSCKSNKVRPCILSCSFCDQGTVLHQANAVSQRAHSFDKPAEFSKFTTV